MLFRLGYGSGKVLDAVIEGAELPLDADQQVGCDRHREADAASGGHQLLHHGSSFLQASSCLSVS